MCALSYRIWHLSGVNHPITILANGKVTIAPTLADRDWLTRTSNEHAGGQTSANWTT